MPNQLILDHTSYSLLFSSDRGGADNQKMTFFGKNFGTCSTMDKCLFAAMPVQMAYYCPKYGRPSCGGKCYSLIKGDCLDGKIRDKEGGIHNFRLDPKFWKREVETWSFGTGKPMWPYNFGGGSCAYDYSAVFRTPAPTKKPPTRRPTRTPTAAPTAAPTIPPKKFTYKREKIKTCSWLGMLPDDAIQYICETRIKEPAARNSCPMTCSAAQYGRNTGTLYNVMEEANNLYLHTKKTKKTCSWLRARFDTERICQKNRNARGNCIQECSAYVKPRSG